MKKSILLLSVAAGLWLACCKPQTEENPQAWPGYEPFPSGYGYMDTVPLQTALANRDSVTLRQHAWSLFAGIMQQADSIDWPLWYTWPNSYYAMNIAQSYTMSPGNANALEARRARGAQSLIARNLQHMSASAKVNQPAPVYPIPDSVKAHYPGSVQGNGLYYGGHFAFNGDILIPTESISLDGYNWIQDNRLYDSSVLGEKYRQHYSNLPAPATYIITKHMYWPVLAPSKQALSAIPAWDDAYFNPATDTGYVGYEVWSRLIAVDPTNAVTTPTASVSYLHNVLEHNGVDTMPTITGNAKVYGINKFYYHQVTAADWAAMDDNDKAILNASSYWAYNKPFGVGDYLVTIAMHVNTRELPSWTMQSMWWSDAPNQGIYSQNRPTNLAPGPWLNYNMVEAYGLTESPSSNQMAMAMNPYIELVSHTLLTNCNNCHIRAGYPFSSGSTPLASYQNPNCSDLLEKLYPGTTPCVSNYVRTDFQWIIPDYAHYVAPGSQSMKKPKKK